MKMIEKLMKMVHEEISDAESYAKCALKYKDEHPVLAKTFYDLSTDEMRHSEMLHQQAVHFVDEYKKLHGDNSVAMMSIYEYLHDDAVDKSHEIKMLWEDYRK